MSSTPAKLNFKVYQGSTLAEVLRWESSTKSYATITGISNSAPVVITAIAHGAPEEWRVKLNNIVGMTELNSGDNYYQISQVTPNTFKINSINSVPYRAYVSGGIVEYNTPINLTGYTARMQIRATVPSTDVITNLTTENGKIVLDSTKGTITLSIPASETAEFNFITAVYNLEVVSSSGIVTTIASGSVGLVKEVTR